MAITGKTGADATFREMKRITIILSKYHGKFVAAIALAQAAGVITAGEAATLTTLVNTAAAMSDALEKLAAYSGLW